MKTATQLKLEGLESAGKHYAVDLARAQQIAQLIGMLGRPISADDVREAFCLKEGRQLQIGNAMGKLFSKKHWDFAGFIRSKRLDSHARTLRTWTLKKKKEVYHAEPVAPTVGTDNGVRFCQKCLQETDKCACSS